MGKSWRGPSQEWRNRISSWEGSSMYKPAPDTGKVNNSFEKEAQGFINTLPISIRGALSDEALNALYSYSYNVGVGNFKKRVLPTLQNYVLGKATAQEVANHMYGTNDRKYRGLQNRRAYEKEAFLKGVNAPSNTNISSRNVAPYTPTATPYTPTLAKINSFSPKNANGYTLPRVQDNKSSFWDSYTTMPQVPINKPEPLSSTEYEPMFKTDTNVNTGSDYLNTIYSEQLEKMQANINDELIEYKKQQDALDAFNQKLAALETMNTSLNNMFADGGYVVKKGDTLRKIAKNNNIPFQDLVAANSQIKDINKIIVGDVINYPTTIADTVTNTSNNTPNTFRAADADNTHRSIEEVGNSYEFSDANNPNANLRYKRKVTTGNGVILDKNQSDILEKKLGHPIERDEQGNVYAVTDDKGNIKSVGTNFELPTAEGSAWSIRHLYEIGKAAVEGNDQAKVLLNNYLASKVVDDDFKPKNERKYPDDPTFVDNIIPYLSSPWLDNEQKVRNPLYELGINKNRILSLGRYYNDPYLRQSISGKAYFNEDATNLRKMLKFDQDFAKVSAIAARVAAAALTHGYSEFLISPILRGTSYVTGNDTYRNIDINTMAGSLVNPTYNPYWSSGLNLVQGFIGGKVNPFTLGTLGIAEGLEMGATALNNAGHDNWARALRGLEFSITPKGGRRNFNYLANTTASVLANQGITWGLHALDNDYGDLEAMFTPALRRSTGSLVANVNKMAYEQSGGTGMNGKATANTNKNSNTSSSTNANIFTRWGNKVAKTAQQVYNFGSRPLHEGLFYNPEEPSQQSTTQNTGENTQANVTETAKSRPSVKQVASNFMKRWYSGITSTEDATRQTHVGEGQNADNFRSHAEIVYTVDGQQVKEPSTLSRVANRLGFRPSTEFITPIELNTHGHMYTTGDEVLGGRITYKGSVKNAPISSINKNWYNSMSHLDGDVIVVTLDPNTTAAVSGSPQKGVYAKYDAPAPPKGSKYQTFNLPATDNLMTLGVTGDYQHYVQYNAGNARVTIAETPNGERFVRMDDTFETHARAEQYNKAQQRQQQSKVAAGLPVNQVEAVSQVMDAINKSSASDSQVTITFNTPEGKGRTITINKTDVTGTTGVVTKAKVQEALKAIYNEEFQKYNTQVNSFKEKLNWYGEASGNSVVYQTGWMPLETFVKFLKTSKNGKDTKSQKEIFMDSYKNFDKEANSEL